MRTALIGATLLLTSISTSPAWGQATTRACGSGEEPGPACLMARKELPALPAGKLFWHLDRFTSKTAADKAAGAAGTVVEAFDSVWLFTIERAGWRSRGGKHVAVIGPLPVEPASTYSAEYLRSIFKPGTMAPLHVHSGPEAFYAVSGDTCLETPDGIKLGRGPGNSLLIKAGPPMLLMAVGHTPRRGFALILHDAHQPPTTLTQTWRPSGLCAQQLVKDQGRLPTGG
jgi:quercetin dioxygenase-like cupin family protein